MGENRRGWPKYLAGPVLVLTMAATAAAQDQQLGARTKAMGGSYTAFEDDPLLVWLNPAGIATQPDQMSIAYQTYTAYPVHEKRGAGSSTVSSVESETILAQPEFLPSYIGFVFQLGGEDEDLAMGVGFARPYYLDYALDEVLIPNQTLFVPQFELEQSLSRFRVAIAKDIRLRPTGEAGFFSHVAFGIGADIGYTQWQFETPEGDPRGDRREASLAPAFGAGILVGVYENLESYTLTFGAAYQSAVEFDFVVDPDILPAFDMPQQVNFGMTIYLHGGLPLRFTVDGQWINWSATAEDPFFSDQEDFRDSFNVSVGAEYRVEAGETVALYPRLGYRRFQAPWGDEDDLPSTAGFKLVLDTDQSDFNILTLGLGISWTTEANKFRTIDLAADFGGDAFNLAIAYTHEF